MYNEIVFLALAFIELCSITLLARFGKEWLYGSILANLALITAFGAKTVAIFGYTTNSGNIFYAAVVYAIYLLIEFYGGSVARRSIWISACSIVFFVVFAQFVVSLGGTSESAQADQAMHVLFQFIPRVAIASVLAFIVSQRSNIFVYESLRKRFLGQKLWLRNIVGVLFSQALDSALFFSIAFWGFLPTAVLLEIMLTGFIAKAVIGILSTPFLYFAVQSKPANISATN